MKSNLLTQTQLTELQQLRDEAMESIKKTHPSLIAGVAGMALSEGGHEKMLELLNTHFKYFQDAARDMPEQYTLNISPDTLGGVDASATFYLAFDKFRPRGAWTLSPTKRQMMSEFHDEMDRRAWLAASYLKLARSYFKGR